jgi:photosystem II stability/assembly factor-like uncharacterized protein
MGTGASSRARVLRSDDRGLTWAIADTPVPAGASAGIYSIAFRNDTHGVVVGGDYEKETEAVKNAAFTIDGGATWSPAVRGLSGFRSVVAYVPGTRGTFIAIGPRGADISEDDGWTWRPMEGPGYDTLSFARGRAVGWAAGAKGSIGHLTIERLGSEFAGRFPARAGLGNDPRGRDEQLFGLLLK